MTLRLMPKPRQRHPSFSALKTTRFAVLYRCFHGSKGPPFPLAGHAGSMPSVQSFWVWLLGTGGKTWTFSEFAKPSAMPQRERPALFRQAEYSLLSTLSPAPFLSPRSKNILPYMVMLYLWFFLVPSPTVSGATVSGETRDGSFRCRSFAPTANRRDFGKSWYTLLRNLPVPASFGCTRLR